MVTVEKRQRYVHQHEVGIQRDRLGKHVSEVRADFCLEAPAREPFRDRICYCFVIFDDEYPVHRILLSGLCEYASVELESAQQHFFIEVEIDAVERDACACAEQEKYCGRVVAVE